jgi:23S rRNA A1618 N6-methylase RlmF
MEYKKFKVCSNDKITNDIKIVLDDAMHLVKKSELYDSSYKYNIILCHNSFYNKIDDLLGFGPAARSRLHNVIIKVRIDPKSNLAFATFPKQCEVDLTYLFAHEMIHCLQAKKYGIMKFNPFRHPEFWKLEGYPEYISRRPQLLSKNYSLVDDIEQVY